MSCTNTAEDLASIAEELVWLALTELPNGPREQSDQLIRGQQFREP